MKSNAQPGTPFTLKKILVILGILILVPMLVLVANAIHIQMRTNYLDHADHDRILAACREALTNRLAYRNDHEKWGEAYKNDVLLLRPLDENVPAPIRAMNPRNVLIRDDRVLINLSLPLSRLGLLAFGPGARQYGTTRYIDGIWFWNGHDTTKTNANGP